EFAPQLPVHVPSAESFIDPDLSWIRRMSGGSLLTGWFTEAQFIPVTLACPLCAPPPPIRPVPVPEDAPEPSGPPLDAPAPVAAGGANVQAPKVNITAERRRAADRGMGRPPDSLVGGVV